MGYSTDKVSLSIEEQFLKFPPKKQFSILSLGRQIGLPNPTFNTPQDKNHKDMIN